MKEGILKITELYKRFGFNPLPTYPFFSLEPHKQNLLIFAALREFAHKGYKGALVENIAKEAQVAKGSIFNYFGDKKSLFLFVFQYALQKVKDHVKLIKEKTVGLNFPERLKSIGKEGLKFTRENPEIFRLYLRLHTESDIEIASTLLKLVRTYSVRFLCDLIEEAKEARELRANTDTLSLAFVLDSVFERLFQSYFLWHMGEPFGIFKSREEAELMVEKGIELIIEGIKGV